MLLALSTFFRTSLSLDPSADVSLAEEIDLQRLYLDIEMARFPDRLHVEIDVPRELEQARLPALILQPIVENAIKYGVRRAARRSSSAIEARQVEPSRMALEISNRLKHGGKDDFRPQRTKAPASACQRLPAPRGAVRQRGRAAAYGPMPTAAIKVALTMPVETNG